jgi:predicted kinase
MSGNLNNTLILLRGLPGAGKSTLAQLFSTAFWVEADKYFEDLDGNYNFDTTKLREAHEWCQGVVDSYMRNDIEKIIVSNTFTTEKEIKPYIELAKKYGYRVTTAIIENRHGNKSVHNVPDETMDKMKKRFQIKL